MGMLQCLVLLTLGLCIGIALGANPIVLDCATPLRDQITSAPADSELLAPAGGCEWAVFRTIKISQPGIILRGVNVRLQAGYARTIFAVEGDRFSMYDFVLTGNRGSIWDKLRQSMVVLRGSNFHLERGQLINSSRDGISVGTSKTRDIDGGVIRDILGIRNGRETVSLSTAKNGGPRTRNIVVDNIRSYRSSARGALEVSDGVENIIVRNIYAEDSFSALGIQDHKEPDQANKNITISNVFAKNCSFGINCQTDPEIIHSNIAITRVNIEGGYQALFMRNLVVIQIHDIRTSNLRAGPYTASFLNVYSLRMRDLYMSRGEARKAALNFEGSQDVKLKSVVLGEDFTTPHGIRFKIDFGRDRTELNVEQSQL